MQGLIKDGLVRVETCRKYTYSNQPKDTWLIILTLAARWGFESMRELAVRQLERIALGPIDKIALYKEHKIDGRLLIPSYIELCRSPTLPSFDDGQRLSMETVLRLAAARERALLRAIERGAVTPTSADVEDAELESIVSDVFELDGLLSREPEQPQRAFAISPEPRVEIYGSNGNGTGSGAGSSCPTIKAPQMPAAASNGAGAQTNVSHVVDSSRSSYLTKCAAGIEEQGQGTFQPQLIGLHKLNLR